MTKRKRYKKVARGEWQHLAEQPGLAQAYTRFAQTVQQAQARAEQQSAQTGIEAHHLLDLRDAGRLLDAYPQLGRYLQGVQERREAEQATITRAAPTGSMPMTEQIGAWATYQDKNTPQGVGHARQLREWVDQDEWVNAAITYYCDRVARADIAILPQDERKTYNRATLTAIQQLFDQPNELGETWPTLLRRGIRDYFTLGRWFWSKNMTAKRQPVALYAEDAATIKIYPQWNGDPDQPRYLYEPDTRTRIPLRNDEVMCLLDGTASWRYSYSRVQTLRSTIINDLRATESAAHLVDMKPPPTLVHVQGAKGPQIADLVSRYDTKLAGRREIMFMGGDGPISVHPLVFSLKDQQWMEWLEYLVKKISVIFGLSVATLNYLGDVNKATAQSQADLEENRGLLPLLLLIEEHLNRDILANYAPTRGWRARMDVLNLRVAFPEISEAARMFHAEKAVDMATKSLAGLPSMTLNQVLQMRGEEPVKGGNTFWVKTPTGVLPWLSYDNEYGDWTPPIDGGQQGAQDPDGGPDTNEEADEDMGTQDTPASQEQEGGGATEGGGEQATEKGLTLKSRGAARASLADTLNRLFQDASTRGQAHLRG